jgi:hypothetical protein
VGRAIREPGRGGRRRHDPRRDTQVRSTGDQQDRAHEWIYIVYDATKAGTEMPTGTTYGTDGPGVGGQAATFFLRFDGATGGTTTPAVVATISG